MTTTVKVTYSAQGSPDTIMTFDLTGIDIESIKKELPQKKKELDSKFSVDPQKSTIRMDDDTSVKNLDYRLD
jgi:ABC-type phosphate transport system substrate-binding protein